MEANRTSFNGDINAKGVPLSHRISKLSGLKWATVAIPLLYIILTLVVSGFGIIKKSFTGADGFTLDYYIKIFTEPLYLKVLLNTLLTGVIVTAACLLLAYPAAYLSVRAKKPIVRRLITGGIMIPYWMSMLVRIFAWQIILQSNGVLNQLLMFLHITEEPIQFLYTTGAVCVSMTHILLPYMFLSLQSNMEGIDANLSTAAAVMGARPARGFVDVFLPLSVPGIFSGSLMVFVLSLGFYIAPALLGGADNMMMSNLIEENMNNFNSNLAAAMSLELLVIVFVILGIAFKFVGNIFVPKK